MPERVLIDTQVFIIGYSEAGSDEGRVLHALSHRDDIILLLSSALEDQLRRVARRVRNKDWAGLIISRMWHDFSVEYISLPDNPFSIAGELMTDVPREDTLIFLTALAGQATLFISSNREFVHAAATQQQLFTCLTPEAFLTRRG